jgi:hypothetical protein
LNANATHINCLANLLNLSAKALLLRLKIVHDDDSSSSEQQLSLDWQDYSPDAAENTVAKTLVKVEVYFPIDSYFKANR